jgi:hypothetical protein
MSGWKKETTGTPKGIEGKGYTKGNRKAELHKS